MRSLLAACLFCGIAFSLSAQQAITPPPKPATDAPANAEVLMLLRAAMPESVVLDKIRAITDKFDTSASALVTLKQAGATEAELKAILAQGAAPAEQPPAAAPADNSPSLTDTMQFIQDKLNEQGRFNFALYTHDNQSGDDASAQYGFEITNIVSSARDCSVSYKVNMTSSQKGAHGDTTTKTDATQIMYMKSMKAVQVMAADYWWNQEMADEGTPTKIAQVQPGYFLLSRGPASKGVKCTRNGKPVECSEPTVVDRLVLTLSFRDEDVANRVAKAMMHAVELCGGGQKSPEPF
ncbi:MAG: hypothetical protein ABSC77_10050 [Terracidiphilus sp.]